MRKLAIGLVLIGLIFQSCQKDEDPNPPNDNTGILNISNLASLKQKMLELHQDDNLITVIEPLNGRIRIDYEREFEIRASSSLIDQYNLDTATWSSNFTFSDNTTMSYQSLGSSLGIQDSALSLDPSGFSPLTGILNYSSPVNGQFSISIKGQDGPGSNINHDLEEYGLDHSIPVYGLYENHSNSVEFIFKDKMGNFRRAQTLKVTTDDIPDSLFWAQVIVNDLPSDDNSLLFLSNTKYAVDKYGKIRWAYTGTEIGAILRKNSKGNLIGWNSSFAIPIYHRDAFLEIDLFGNVIHKVDLPNMVHHDVWEMPNGNYLIGTSSTFPNFNDGNPDEDLIVEIDPTTGSIVDQWDLNLIMDPLRPSFDITGTRPDDWNHNNSLKYYPEDNSILISARNQLAVLSIDYSSKEINWILGIPVNWNDPFDTKLLTATNISDSSEWFWMQHAPVFKENGDLILFDNGKNRELLTSDTNQYSRAVTYRIDQQNMQVTQVNEWGKERPDLYSHIRGDVDELFFNDQSHTLICFSQRSTVIIINSNNEVVYEVKTSTSNYRAEKISLY